MKRIKRIFPLKFIYFLVIILLASCNNSKNAPPFPILENEYTQPITKSFEFSRPDTLTWITRDPSKIKNLPTTAFDWDKLPSKPFDISTPYALKKPLETKPFVLDSLQSVDFKMENLPQQNLNIKVRILGKPKVVKAGYPVTLDGVTRGVMNLDANFGLPGTSFCSLKDKYGMLWFGTNGGVVRYDSENLEIYGLEQGLNVNSVFTLLKDSKGRLWCAGNSGNIVVIDFEAKLVYELTSSYIANQVYGMMEDNEGKIWYSQYNEGYHIIDLEEKIVRVLGKEQGLQGVAFINPWQDNDNLIWLSSERGANIIDLKKGKHIKLTKDNGLLGNFVSSFFQDSYGKIWITGAGGVQIIDKNKATITYFTADQGLEGIGAASEVFQDKSGKFYIGSTQGLLFSYSESKGLLEKFKITNANSQFVFNILEDKQGQIWVSVAQGGLFILNLDVGKPANFDKDDGLSSNDMWATLEAQDGKIWIGSAEGIDIYDPIKHTVKYLGEENGLISARNTRLMQDSKGRIWGSGNALGVNIIDPNKETIQQLKTDKELGANRIRAIFQDENDLFWMGGITGELITLDMENLIINNLSIDTTNVQDSNNIIIQDAKSNIWIGGLESGIQKINLINNTNVKLTTANGLVSDRIYSLHKDSENNIWAATQEGVERIDLSNNQLTTFKASEGLGANDAYAILEHKGEIYTGTSKGLTILKPSYNSNFEFPYWKVKTIGQKQGINLVDFAENSFSFDKNGRFWASLVQDLTVFDEIIEDTTAYPTFITGINILDKKQVFNDVKKIKEKTAAIDTLWARDKNRFYMANKSFVDSSFQFQNDIKWKSVQGAHEIPEGLELPYTQNYLSFNYNGGQFSNADKVVYRYILEGIDKNWSPISKETTSENYRDLPAGDYSFKVASKGFNEIWSVPSELKFTITPPWWKTWWAYTIFVVLFLGLGLVILHYRSQWLKNENRILEERVNDRTAELKRTIDELENTQSQLIQSEKMASLGELTAGIAHEIQNPMNFINNFAEVSNELIDEMCEELDKGDIEEAKLISKDIVQNLEKISHHGKRASSIVKGMLEHSRNSSGKMELTDINVLADEYLRLAYHGLRAKDKSFNADFKTDLDPSISKIEIMPQDIGRVILNLINNAFYAVTSIPTEERGENYKPLVTVITKNLGDQVLIAIKDNGPGIPKEIKDKIFQPFFTTKPTGKGTGLGLSLAYDIITTGHGGAIELNTEPGEGTEFSIYIPVKKS